MSVSALDTFHVSAPTHQLATWVIAEFSTIWSLLPFSAIWIIAAASTSTFTEEVKPLITSIKLVFFARTKPGRMMQVSKVSWCSWAYAMSSFSTCPYDFWLIYFGSLHREWWSKRTRIRRKSCMNHSGLVWSRTAAAPLTYTKRNFFPFSVAEVGVNAFVAASVYSMLTSFAESLSGIRARPNDLWLVSSMPSLEDRGSNS